MNAFNAMSVHHAVQKFVRETSKKAYLNEIDGLGVDNDYYWSIDEINKAISALKWARGELLHLKSHTHEWNVQKMCSVCGVIKCG